jgi:RimJ/RimL family protein N-acetyltransferase
MATRTLPERFEEGDLLLQRWRVEDALAQHEAIVESEEHLRPWMPWIGFEPRTVDQRAELIAQWEREWLEGGDVMLAVWLDGVVAGSTGLHHRIGPNGLEIGYWIRASHTRRRLATRVARLLTTGALTIPGITHVEIHCDQANVASAGIPEKLGYAYVGDVPRDIEAPSETGTHRVYRIDRSGWKVA